MSDFNENPQSSTTEQGGDARPLYGVRDLVNNSSLRGAGFAAKALWAAINRETREGPSAEARQRQDRAYEAMTQHLGISDDPKR